MANMAKGSKDDLPDSEAVVVINLLLWYSGHHFPKGQWRFRQKHRPKLCPISRRCAPGQLAKDCKCLPSERWRIELLRHAFPLEPETNARFEPPLSASSVKGANKRGRSETERLTNLRRD